MQMGKNVALVALGAAALWMYQKYSKPVMRKAEEIMNDALEMADKKLDDMM